MMDAEQVNRATAAAFAEPRVGDRYTEMYSFWLFVVDVRGGMIETLEGNSPCEFPQDGKRWIGPKEAFQERFAYKSPSLEGQYWLRLVDRDNDVSHWASGELIMRITRFLAAP
jgi:hypothetical protein